MPNIFWRFRCHHCRKTLSLVLIEPFIFMTTAGGDKYNFNIAKMRLLDRLLLFCFACRPNYQDLEGIEIDKIPCDEDECPHVTKIFYHPHLVRIADQTRRPEKIITVKTPSLLLPELVMPHHFRCFCSDQCLQAWDANPLIIDFLVSTERKR